MKNNSPTITSRRLKLFAWINISIQTISPVLLAFTPKMVAAEVGSNLLGHAPAPQIETKVYTLSAGETTNSVASDYNMTIDSLRRLNQFRTFSRGFEYLKEGDELDVPLSPLPEVTWERIPDQSTETDPAQQDHANYAVKAGSFLASSGKDKAAVSMARGMATGAAGNEIEQWLSQFGTARVKIDADEKFSLKNSQLDMLVPLFDRNTDILYTQGSIHRTDDRTQANLGFGWRHFDVTHMFGGNVFYDRDLSRNHSRLGLGGEYWRDFLKLGANSYFRLSNWRNSPDVSNYEERPANGWDLRAQAWLPAFPQLGGNLTIEKYYGNEVALFGKDNRQRNPHSLAAGVNYTPVPLITFSAEHRQGKQGADDTRLGMELNWQPGVPWQHQISTDAVGVMRSLEGSRYNLVERNNNIVLEYRKKEFLRLNTADLVTGYSGDEKSLGVSVNSKYGLARIDWDAGAFLAAGGKIIQNDGYWSTVLPAWQNTGENTYTIVGTAVDKRNNHSNKSSTQVTVKAPIVSAIRSTFTPPQTTLPADGRSTQLLTLTVKDDSDQAIALPLTSVSLAITGLKEAKVSELTKKNDGIFELVVTAGQQEESITITPTVSGLAISPAVVNVKTIMPEA
ncbi:inverse autotransporter beta domain-containing protein, partial [Lelliottia nimipressuralis]